MARDDAVTLPEPTLAQYDAVSLYNSPYPAHDAGSAVDLYPGPSRDSRAPSPLAGEVLDTRTVNAPSRPYAVAEDHLVVIDTGERLARILHVEPAVEPGDTVGVGDELGMTVRSGYFDPWVDDHLHLGFRPPDADPYRATGSLPVRLDARIEPVAWDGTGEVIERGDTFSVLDPPAHPAPGEAFAGVAVEVGDGIGALDGGLPHYERGGVFVSDAEPGEIEGVVELTGIRVGHATGRTVTWDDVEVRANGTRVDGLSLALSREDLLIKLVSWDGPPGEVGERVSVTVGLG